MPGTTPHWGLPFSDGADLAATIDDTMDALATALDDHTKFAAGPFTSRGTAASRKAGFYYLSTDSKQLDLSDGTNWITLMTSQASGKVNIPGEEFVTSASYSWMPTPDRVSGLVLPTDGHIEIGYQALISTAASSRAAIFIGSNQLRVQADETDSLWSPKTQAAVLGFSSGMYTPLNTCAVGLQSWFGEAVNATADVTTGQALGGISNARGAMDLGGVIVDSPPPPPARIDGDGNLEMTASGGVCRVFAAAGTYDVGVMFKSDGSTEVLAKGRKLWVRVIPY